MSSLESTRAPVPPLPSPRRRWLRFSLRTFLLFVTVLCIWLGMRANRARQQKEAVEALRGLGVYVNYEHWRVNGDFDTFNSSHELAVPQWLRELVGDHYFERVVALRYLPPYDDEALVHLGALPDLQSLHVSGTGNNFTDAGLAHLPRPDRLIHLDAASTFIGNGFVKRLANATGLETLILSGTRVTDEGLQALPRLPKLKQLGLDGTQITDAGLAAALKGRKSLEHLGLARTNITDTSLALLQDAKQLRFLSLDRTKVTDAGLRHLRGLPALISVTVEGTPITPQGMAALTAASPSLGLMDDIRAGRKHPKEYSKFLRKQRRGPSPRLQLPAEDKADAQAP